MGRDCIVVTPSLIPVKSGDQVKIDRRDAILPPPASDPNYIDTVGDAEERVERLKRQIGDLLPSWSLSPIVETVQAMRGVGFIVAVTEVAEVGDFRRFENPRQLTSYLGLTPSEHSSGATVRRAGSPRRALALPGML